MSAHACAGICLCPAGLALCCFDLLLAKTVENVKKETKPKELVKQKGKRRVQRLCAMPAWLQLWLVVSRPFVRGVMRVIPVRAPGGGCLSVFVQSRGAC